jgi:hypothetical protein
MTEYRVVWCKKGGTGQHRGVLFVEAENKNDAHEVAAYHIERKLGIAWYIIARVEEACPPPKGKVVKEA